MLISNELFQLSGVMSQYLRCPGFKSGVRNWLLQSEAFGSHQFMQANVAVHRWNRSDIAISSDTENEIFS
jgi:hypothetical protein